MLFPLWIMAFIVLSMILLFVFWLWALIDCLKSKLNVPEKLSWIIILLFLHFIGAFIYLIFSKIGGHKMVKTKSFKGKKLFRSKKNRMIAGVCGGLGEYLGVDPTIIRLLWVLLVFLSFGAAILAYIIAWIIIPKGR